MTTVYPQAVLTKDDGTTYDLSSLAGAVAGGTAPATSTVVTVADNATSVTLKAANALRKGLSLTNTSSAVLYAYLNSGAAVIATAYTVKIPNGTTYVLDLMRDGVYTGAITGIWASDPGDGVCIVAEFT